MAGIVLERVSKRFPDGTEALRDVSLEIGDGELFVLVGPSGCGKSTLLNVIVGLEPPSAGEIRVEGERVNEVDAKDRGMAMVFQSYALYPHMSVRENLAFPLRMAKTARAEIEERVERTARLLKITPLLDRKPRSLSGGQRQRVAMGRALVREPAAFLMDEPLSNLDARLRLEMRTEIARLQRRLGVTTIYVTHDQGEAMTLGDRLAVLRDGVLQQVGTPRELFEDPANLFVASFLGSPPINLLPARLRDGSLELPMLQTDLAPSRRGRVAAAGAGVVAGIRPGDLSVGPRRAGGGASLRVRIDVLEWLGTEAFATFEVEVPDWASDHRLHAAASVGAPERAERISVTVRLDPQMAVREGDELEVRFDPARLLLFGRDGVNLDRTTQPWSFDAHRTRSARSV